MKGYYYDLPSELNHDQFNKTTKMMAIKMGSDMGVYAQDLAMAYRREIGLGWLSCPTEVSIKEEVECGSRERSQFVCFRKGTKAFN